MNIRPLFDRILVKRLPEEDCTKGGIIIPSTAQEKPTRATVCAVGPGATSEQGTLRPLSVKKGDQVLFGKYNGTEVQIDGEDYVILSESEVLAVIEPEYALVGAGMLAESEPTTPDQAPQAEAPQAEAQQADQAS